MRKWRKTHPLSAEQRFKANARTYTKMLRKRGKIKKLHCIICANPESEAHHNDYSDPYDITWMCRSCHMNHHHQIKHSFIELHQ